MLHSCIFQATLAAAKEKERLEGQENTRTAKLSESLESLNKKYKKLKEQQQSKKPEDDEVIQQRSLVSEL